MLDVKNHFLESNIIIGLSVKWDNQNPICQEYRSVSDDNHWFSSKKVLEEEVEPIINGLRQDMLKIVEESRPSEASNLDTFKQNIWDILESLNEGKFDKLERYIDFRSDIFSKFIQNSVGVNKLLLKVDEDFDNPSKFVLGIKQNSSRIMYLPYNNTKNIQRYNSEYGKLFRLMGHEDDSEVLLDAHHFTEENDGDKIAFITTDNEHINNNSGRIESILGRIEVYNPHEELR